MSIMNAKQFYGKERGQKANFPNDNMEYKIRYGNNAAHGLIFVELTSKKCNKSPPPPMTIIPALILCGTELIYSRIISVLFNPYNAEICLYKPWRPKVYFHLKSS